MVDIGEESTGFAMERFNGRSIKDLILFDEYIVRVGELITNSTLAQLKAQLIIAYERGYNPFDVQYIVLTEPQILNGKRFSPGDIVFFDLELWRSRSDLGEYFPNELQRLLEQLCRYKQRCKTHD